MTGDQAPCLPELTEWRLILLADSSLESRSKTNEGVFMKWVLLSTIAVFAICPAIAQHAPSPQAIKFEDIKWEPLEGGGEISILYTNPTSKATYLIIRAEQECARPTALAQRE